MTRNPLPALATMALLLGACAGPAKVGVGPPDAALPDGEASVAADGQAEQDSFACKLFCPGCCVGSTCRLGTTSGLCGTGGDECQDCTLTGQTCSKGACVGACTPYCKNRCKGESDGCGGTCPASTCSGCCDSAGKCQPGTSASACGASGGTCTSCNTGYTCTSGSCKCVPSCSNKCQGQSDGCGGTCPANTCSGCCSSANACQPGTSASACGTGGAACVSCPTTAPTCSGGTCKCVVDCKNKCQGQGDGCGGTCPSNTCSGCCDSASTCKPGTSASACGAGGTACVACNTGFSCTSAGTCKCVASCTGKCKGADDGCGGTCPMNHCNGCCDASYKCLSGKSDTACGNNGAACTDCTSSSQVCSKSGVCS